MPTYGLDFHGIRKVSASYFHLTTSVLYEKPVSRGEGLIAHLGPLVGTGTWTSCPI